MEIVEGGGCQNSTHPGLSPGFASAPERQAEICHSRKRRNGGHFQEVQDGGQSTENPI